MLVDLMTERPIAAVPYEAEYRAYMARMTRTEIDAIKATLNAMIDGDEIHTPAGCRGTIGPGHPFSRFTRRLRVIAIAPRPSALASWFGKCLWSGPSDGPQAALKRTARALAAGPISGYGNEDAVQNSA